MSQALLFHDIHDALGDDSLERLQTILLQYQEQHGHAVDLNDTRLFPENPILYDAIEARCSPDIIRLLLENGAKVDAPVRSVEKSNEYGDNGSVYTAVEEMELQLTPLGRAIVESDQEEVLTLLLIHGANVAFTASTSGHSLVVSALVAEWLGEGCDPDDFTWESVKRNVPIVLQRLSSLQISPEQGLGTDAVPFIIRTFLIWIKGMAHRGRGCRCP